MAKHDGRRTVIDDHISSVKRLTSFNVVYTKMYSGPVVRENATWCTQLYYGDGR